MHVHIHVHVNVHATYIHCVMLLGIHVHVLTVSNFCGGWHGHGYIDAISVHIYLTPHPPVLKLKYIQARTNVIELIFNI